MYAYEPDDEELDLERPLGVVQVVETGKFVLWNNKCEKCEEEHKFYCGKKKTPYRQQLMFLNQVPPQSG